MRDILFRGKMDDGGYWVYGGLIANKFISVSYQSSIDEEFSVGFVDVVPETLGQFAGLYDKNGTKIFEGDVVKTKFGRLCVVEWFSTRAYCGWDLSPVDTFHNICHTEPPTEYDMWEDKNLEVVGNIHDNPEFRKVAR